VKKRVFQFRDSFYGVDPDPLFWIDEDGTFDSDSDAPVVRDTVDLRRKTIEADRETSELYAHIFYEYDSDYEDAFFALVSVTRGAAPPFEGWNIEVLVEPEKAWRPSGLSADGVKF